MEIKELIAKYCDNLQGILSLNGKRGVKFVSGWKNSMYHIPQIMIGSNIPKTQMAWFGEIWVDGVCVFRESRIPLEGQSDEELENRVLDDLMRSIFNHGVMAANKILEDIKTNH